MASKWKQYDTPKTPNDINSALSAFASQTESSEAARKKSTQKKSKVIRPHTAYPDFKGTKDYKQSTASSVSVALLDHRGSRPMRNTDLMNPRRSTVYHGEPGQNYRKATLKAERKNTNKSLSALSSQNQQKLNELRLHQALQGFDERLLDEDENDNSGKPKNTRASETIRRYSQLPREKRLSIKYRDALELRERPQTVISSLASVTSLSQGPSSAASVGNVRTPGYDNAKKAITKSYRSSLKNRKAEEEALQDMMGSRVIRYLVTHTHFNESEVKALQRIFRALTINGTEEGIDRIQFREIMSTQFGISGDAMLDQIYYYFDADHEGFISVTEFINNMSILLRGTFEEHTKFCFQMYDLKGEGCIGKNEILSLLQDCLQWVPGVEDDITDHNNIRELADMMLRKFDKEKRRYITLENFRAAVRRDPTCLQCLGQCLPEPKAVKTFMALIADDYNSFRSNLSVPRMPNYDYERNRFNAGVQESRLHTAFKKARTAVRLMGGILSRRSVSSFQFQTAGNSVMKGYSLAA